MMCSDSVFDEMAMRTEETSLHSTMIISCTASSALRCRHSATSQGAFAGALFQEAQPILTY